MPILFVCEDNGIGISTGTPTGRHRIARVTAADNFIPLAEAAQLVLPDRLRPLW
ncbi:hypothetical protein [Sedimenticola hydrogenitrophicus]|uniref:hypothetical protein n=1 Tax=Sedimenticola hydrogenitrophicus TaxID=2967975 RepID=UPI0021A8792C|nr:hypothetical protein [Sedimenticola hydrogenitrophicus]